MMQAQNLFSEISGSKEEELPSDQTTNENVTPARDADGFGFSTGSGKRITVSKEALEQAQKIFSEEQDSAVKDLQKDVVTNENAISAANEFGFSMASEMKATVSKNALLQAHELYSEVSNSAMQDLPKNTTSNGNENTATTEFGFSSASGKKVTVSEKSLLLVKNKFLEDNSSRFDILGCSDTKMGSTSCSEKGSGLSEVQCFKDNLHMTQNSVTMDHKNRIVLEVSAGSEKRFASPAKSLSLAKKVCLEGSTSMSFGFSTAGGREVPVSEKALIHSKKLLDEESNSVLGSSLSKFSSEIDKVLSDETHIDAEQASSEIYLHQRGAVKSPIFSKISSRRSLSMARKLFAEDSLSVIPDYYNQETTLAKKFVDSPDIVRKSVSVKHMPVDGATPLSVKSVIRSKNLTKNSIHVEKRNIIQKLEIGQKAYILESAKFNVDDDSKNISFASKNENGKKCALNETFSTPCDESQGDNYIKAVDLALLDSSSSIEYPTSPVLKRTNRRRQRFKAVPSSQIKGKGSISITPNISISSTNNNVPVDSLSEKSMQSPCHISHKDESNLRENEIDLWGTDLAEESWLGRQLDLAEASNQFDATFKDDIWNAARKRQAEVISSKKNVRPIVGKHLQERRKGSLLRSRLSDLVKGKRPGRYFREERMNVTNFERSMHIFISRYFTPENVMRQLKYRWDREIDGGERPALRKILEMDDIASKRIVLCISSIEKPEIIQSSKNLELDLISSSPKLELTDGWYAIRGIIDADMAALIQKGKLSVGTKIITSGAELVNGPSNGCHPLEPPAAKAAIRLNTNSTRRARWDVKLGYVCKNPGPLPVSLGSLLPGGGAVSALRNVMLARVYPILNVEKTPDGRKVVRSQKAEARVAVKFERQRQIWLENLYSQVSAEIQKEEEEEAKLTRQGKRARSEKSISNHNSKRPKRNLAVDKKGSGFTGTLSPEELLKLIEESEDSSSLQARLVDADQPVLSKSAVLTVWRPSEEVISLLAKEGVTLNLYNLLSNGMRSSFLQLSSTRQTRYKVNTHLACKMDRYPLLQRVILSRAFDDYISQKVSNVGAASDCMPPFGEIDLVAMVIKIGDEPEKGKGVGYQHVFVAGSDGSLLTLAFWGGITSLLTSSQLKLVMDYKQEERERQQRELEERVRQRIKEEEEKASTPGKSNSSVASSGFSGGNIKRDVVTVFKEFALDDVLVPEVTIVATNLQWRRHHGLARLPTVHAVETSNFSQHPGEERLKNALKKFEDELKDEMQLVANKTSSKSDFLSYCEEKIAAVTGLGSKTDISTKALANPNICVKLDVPVNSPTERIIPIRPSVATRMKKLQMYEGAAEISLPARLVDADQPVLSKSAVLTVWRPSEEVISLLAKEGVTLNLYNLLSNGMRSSFLQLSSTRQTRYKVNTHLACKMDRYPLLQRVILSRAFDDYISQKVSNVGAASDCMPPFGEIDLVAMVIKIGDEPEKGKGVGYQHVFVAGSDGSLLTLAFWGGITVSLIS
ncbi:hypothetical protein J437_LFUL007979 [Ladona fulva]|uniref:Tower domain-containing protein n=1 Tax=Ladona fulva TaxID=123851 RepID=A0A8K0NZN9_LADFU|nr:hypothetical protein J437_LFUL007979 [Ladona fulva]